MIVHKAYLDESGLHGNPVVTGVAGFMAPEPAWTEIEATWSDTLERLRRDVSPAIDQFHAVDCENGSGCWRDIARPIREAFYFRFTDILCEQEALKGVAISIDVDEWERVGTPEIKARMGSPYQMCAEHCFQQIAAWSVRAGATGEPVDLMFAEHPKLSIRANEIFGYYLRSRPWMHIRSLAFGSPCDHVGLQCADLLSYESYLYWREIQVKGLGFGSERPAMDKLMRAGKIGTSACYDGLGLAHAIKRFHIHEGLTDPFPDL